WIRGESYKSLFINGIGIRDCHGSRVFPRRGGIREIKLVFPQVFPRLERIPLESIHCPSVCTYVHRRQVIACSPRVKFCCGQELGNRDRPAAGGSIES